MCDECEKKRKQGEEALGKALGVSIKPIFSENHESGPDESTAEVKMLGTPRMADVLRGFEIMSNTVTQDADSGAAITVVVAGNERFLEMAKKGDLAYTLGAAMSATSMKDTMRNLGRILMAASQNAGMDGGMKDEDEPPTKPSSGTLH